MFLKCASKFALRERKHTEAQVAEEYCQAITPAARWSCCGRSGHSYKHTHIIRILNSD